MNAKTRMLWSQFHIGCLGLRENFIAILTTFAIHDAMM